MRTAWNVLALASVAAAGVCLWTDSGSPGAFCMLAVFAHLMKD